jgi:hypothetical protein
MKTQSEVIQEYKQLYHKSKLNEKDIAQVSKFSLNTKSLKEIDEAVVEASNSSKSEEDLVTPIGGEITPIPKQDEGFTNYIQNTK